MNAIVLSGEVERIIERHRSTGWEGLEPKKRAFAIAYCESFSHVQAARDIKHDGNGMKYMRDPLVLALISDILDHYKNINVVTEHFVRSKLMELLPKLMGEEKVPVVTGSGIALEEKKFFPGEARAVLESLGKSIGMMGQNEKDKGGVNINLNFGAVQTPGITVDAEVIDAD